MEADDIEGPANPSHPDHRAFITEWTRSAAASEVIEAKTRAPQTPEQIAAPMRAAAATGSGLGRAKGVLING